MVDRINPDDGDLYGVAGHEHCERFAATHCRRAGNQPGRSNLGADQLPGGERGGPPPQRMAEPVVWPKKLLHGMRSTLHAHFVSMRDSPEPWALDIIPSVPGDRRRRLGSFGTGYAGRRLSASKARGGFRALQHGHRISPGTWANSGRVDNR